MLTRVGVCALFRVRVPRFRLLQAMIPPIPTVYHPHRSESVIAKLVIIYMGVITMMHHSV